MKRIFVVTAVAIVFGVVGTVGAALFLPVAPPSARALPWPQASHAGIEIMSSPMERPSTVESRVLVAAAILTQA